MQGLPAELQFEDGKLKFLSGERWRRALDLLLRLAFHSSIMPLGQGESEPWVGGSGFDVV